MAQTATAKLSLQTSSRFEAAGAPGPPARLAVAGSSSQDVVDFHVTGKACLQPAAPSTNAPDAGIIRTFAEIPTLLEQDPALILSGKWLDCECLLGPTDRPFHVTIRSGRIVDLTPSPVLMRSWRFSYRATPAAWAEYWKPAPRPGWHDLLALTKRREAALEGDLHPFMTHLQYFKDVLALPRQHQVVPT